MADQLQREPTDPGARRGPNVSLSARESEVLLWIARGASNNEIAEIVGLSPHTVDTYCRRVLTKFETSSRVTAAVRAAQSGFLPLI